jgi:hypothetical protein
MVKQANSKASISSKLGAFALAIVSASCIGLIHVTQAHAGGDEFDGPDDTPISGPSYFGFVRDTRGVGVANAEVVLAPPNEPAVSMKTNILGLYRSHVSKDAAPEDVKVTCSLAGYVQIKVVRRQGDSNPRQIETDCVLQKT